MGCLNGCRMALAAAVFTVAWANAAEAPRRAFSAVPKQALVELKATVGKPFSSGLVFVDGKFLAPPYKVERYGTALRINGQQVTGQIIPWDEFLKTQADVRMEKVEPPAGGSAEAASVPAEPAPAPEVDVADDLDDLFSDTPAPKKRKSAAPAPAVKRPAPPPEPTMKVVFEGEFRQNEKTKKMLNKLNKIRTDVEVLLRKGSSCFFGTRYSAVTADRGPTDMFLQAIPAVMKDSSSFEEFSSAARSRGVTYLSEAVLRDLFRNRLDYIRLQERAKKVKEERKWDSMLNGSL